MDIKKSAQKANLRRNFSHHSCQDSNLQPLASRVQCFTIKLSQFPQSTAMAITWVLSTIWVHPSLSHNHNKANVRFTAEFSSQTNGQICCKSKITSELTWRRHLARQSGPRPRSARTRWWRPPGSVLFLCHYCLSGGRSSDGSVTTAPSTTECLSQKLWWLRNNSTTLNKRFKSETPMDLHQNHPAQQNVWVWSSDRSVTRTLHKSDMSLHWQWLFLTKAQKGWTESNVPKGRIRSNAPKGWTGSNAPKGWTEYKSSPLYLLSSYLAFASFFSPILTTEN